MYITLYVLGLLIGLILTGVFYQLTHEDDGTMQFGIAASLFWPVTLGLTILLLVFAGPIYLGIYLTKKYKESKNEMV